MLDEASNLLLDKRSLDSFVLLHALGKYADTHILRKGTLGRLVDAVGTHLAGDLLTVGVFIVVTCQRC
jgi:hypothetical protein